MPADPAGPMSSHFRPTIWPCVRPAQDARRICKDCPQRDVARWQSRLGHCLGGRLMTAHRFLVSLLAVLAFSPTSLRADKPEKPPADLAARCRKMHDLQVALTDGTKALHKAIDGTPDKKPRPEDLRAALKLADSAKAIVAEATGAIEMLEKDGSAVAFVEVVKALREDLRRVQARLEKGEVGTVTQAIEKDSLDTLKEMIRALTKAH